MQREDFSAGLNLKLTKFFWIFHVMQREDFSVGLNLKLTKLFWIFHAKILALPFYFLGQDTTI